MNQHTINVLEFPKLIKIIQTYAHSEPGRLRLGKFLPQTDVKRAFRMTPLFKAFMEMRQKSEEFPKADFHSPSLLIKKMAPLGSHLDTLEIHVIVRLLRISDKVARFVTRDSFKDFEALAPLKDGL
ncbi:MAG: hypothetical protein HRT88_16335, partial [Lentisphaeraceae bacterium]|nr:hypothetical protein [Lentisphaeraceae bacterium]